MADFGDYPFGLVCVLVWNVLVSFSSVCVGVECIVQLIKCSAKLNIKN